MAIEAYECDWNEDGELIVGNRVNTCMNCPDWDGTDECPNTVCTLCDELED